MIGRETESEVNTQKFLTINKFFPDKSPQPMGTKAKINQCDYIKLIIFCKARETQQNEKEAY